jgi:hypothetical protein
MTTVGTYLKWWIKAGVLRPFILFMWELGVIFTFLRERAQGRVNIVLALIGAASIFVASSNAQAQHTVARQWDDQMLDAIRLDTPRPTVHARNLFHVSAAMYDAWSAYDGTSTQYLHQESASAVDVAAARDEAISFAAYNVLKHRFQTGPGSVASLAAFDSQMDMLGYDKTFSSTVGSSPAALGNRIAQTIINAGATDGANEQNDYTDTSGYAPVNTPMIKDLPGTSMNDPNRWQPLAFDHLVLQNNIVIGTAVQEFISPNWGDVTPFAMSKASPTDVYHDVGAPPQLGDVIGGGDTEFKVNILDVIRKSSVLDPSQGNMINLSPSAKGNSTLGTNDGTGYGANNPVTGLPYAANMGNLADYGRGIAEFWADGPSSETPPGHWNVLANDVGDTAGFQKKIGGVGPVVDDLEWDIKMYFAMNGAVHDAAVAAWNHKGVYDYSRPVSMIRYMGGKGQSTNPLGTAYDVEGLPLETGLVEVITSDSTMVGERHEHLAGHEGEIAIFAWAGEPADTENEVGGVDWIRAVEWLPYQKSTFVTPAFAAYLSGHSTFSRAAAEIMAAMTGTEYFPGGLGEYTITVDALEFESGPDTDLVLQWATYYDAADEAGLSRLYGGIHVAPDDGPARIMGSMIGIDAYNLASQYYDGTVAVPEPASLVLLLAGASAGLLRRRD